MVQPYTGTKTPGFIDDSQAEIPLSLGIYKGIIKQIDTGTRSGRLYVYIEGLSGPDPNNPSNWQLVNYASPFLGSTTGPISSPQYNNFPNTQQTYGFYMTPPDLGNMVLCCFPAGKTKEGYWFACISSNLSKRMVPAGGAVPLSSIDPVSLSDEAGTALRPFLQPGGLYPVGEFNENDKNVYRPDWAKNKYPINTILTNQLINAGLDTDTQCRGAITSSIQRDPISTVFGFSSPGRPFASQDPKNIPNLQAKLASGNFTAADFNVTGRVGGHSLTMDDGDMYGTSNIFKLRSSAGHQILFNDTSGFIYISNSAGTAWVELSNNGDVLIYSARDLSIRSQANVMIHSDRNMSFNAGGTISMRAQTVAAESAGAMQLNAGQFLNMYGKQAQLKSGGSLSLASAGTMAIKAGGVMLLDGSKIALNGGGGGGSDSQPKPLTRYLNPDTIPTPSGWTIRTNSVSSLSYKLPSHEPYVRGGRAQVEIIGREQELAAANANISGGNITTVTGETISSNTIPTLSSSAAVQTAKAESIQNPAPAQYFISQSDPGTGVGGLTNDDVRALLAQSGYAASNNNYSTFNESGFAGKYQMDVNSLIQIGLVKPGTQQTAEALSNPSNWIGAAGNPTNLSEFLNSPQAQDSAQVTYMTQNYAELQKAGIITPTTSKEDIAGILNVASAAGANVAAGWYTGTILNAYTPTFNALFNQGRYSQVQVPTIISSNASKTIAGG